jgi:hypothetical protein
MTATANIRLGKAMNSRKLHTPTSRPAKATIPSPHLRRKRAQRHHHTMLAARRSVHMRQQRMMLDLEVMLLSAGNFPAVVNIQALGHSNRHRTRVVEGIRQTLSPADMAHHNQV